MSQQVVTESVGGLRSSLPPLLLRCIGSEKEQMSEVEHLGISSYYPSLCLEKIILSKEK